MKTQNTPENKAKFFALHLGGNVQQNGLNQIETLIAVGGIGDGEFQYIKSRYGTPENGRVATTFIKDATLIAKPLSAISDEDAIEVGRLHGHHNDEEPWSDDYLKGVGKRVASYFPKFITPVPVSDQLNLIDFLRSKGYLIGWMDLTPEDIIGYGWVKLEEQG